MKIGKVLRATFPVPFYLFGPFCWIMPFILGLWGHPISVILFVIGALSQSAVAHRLLRLEIQVRRLEGKKPCLYGMEDDWPPMPTREEIKSFGT